MQIVNEVSQVGAENPGGEKGFLKKRKWRKRLAHTIGLGWKGQTAVDLLQKIANIMHKER